MKYNLIIWTLLSYRIRKGLEVVAPQEDGKALVRKAKPIYKELLSQVEGISNENPMSSNIIYSFVGLAVWLASDKRISPDTLLEAFVIAISWGPIKKSMEKIDLNTEEGMNVIKQKLHKADDWAKQHPEDTNNWDFHFDDTLHEDGFYYYFTKCPIASFCKEHGYEEFTHACCDIDHVTFNMEHGILHREGTVAEGKEKCDYWIVGDKQVDPK